jgi:hypothetical protein
MSQNFYEIKPLDLEDFSACLLYMSIKLDFNSLTYDYNSQGIPEGYSYETFENRKDKHFFKKLASKFQYQERYIPLLAINAYKNKKIYALDLLSKDCLMSALGFKKYQNTILESFETDIQRIKYKLKIELVEQLYHPIYSTNYFALESENKISSSTSCILNYLFSNEYFKAEDNELYQTKSFYLNKLFKYLINGRIDLTKEIFMSKLIGVIND